MSAAEDSLREFLRAELEQARLSPQRSDARGPAGKRRVAAFVAWCRPMMALGTIPVGVRDTMVSRGLSDGLTREQALETIERVVAECGAKLESEESS